MYIVCEKFCGHFLSDVKDLNGKLRRIRSGGIIPSPLYCVFINKELNQECLFFSLNIDKLDLSCNIMLAVLLSRVIPQYFLKCLKRNS